MTHAAAGLTQEALCESEIRGRTTTAGALRQWFATLKVQEWQERHPTLPFTALLAFFRLAGKEYDRLRLGR